MEVHSQNGHDSVQLEKLLEFHNYQISLQLNKLHSN